MLCYSGFGLDRFLQDAVLFRVWFKEGLYRMLFYSGFGLDRFIQDAVLFRFWFRQVYTVSCFIQGLV